MTFYDVYDVMSLIIFVANDVIRLIMFVTYDVCHFTMFVANLLVYAGRNALTKY